METDPAFRGVTYYHLLFDAHEIIYANGCEAESLFTGQEALKAVGEEGRNEIREIFPELMNADYRPRHARSIVDRKQADKLILRHVKNLVPLTYPYR